MPEDNPDELADALEREADHLERRSDQLREQVEAARQDWERKRRDDSVPGARAVPPDEESSPADPDDQT
jgi:hypothetical protein